MWVHHAQGRRQNITGGTSVSAGIRVSQSTQCGARGKRSVRLLV